MIFGATVVLLLILWAVWCRSAFMAVGREESKVTVEMQDWYEVQVNGKPHLYYIAQGRDSLFGRLSEKRDTALFRTVAYGRWTNMRWWLPWCKGRVVISCDSIRQPEVSPESLLEENLTVAEKRLKNLDVMSSEMEYFFSVHSVQDEGYELVTERYEKNKGEISRLSRVVARLKEILASDSVAIRHKALYLVRHKDEAGKTVIDTCVIERFSPMENGGMLAVLQTSDAKTPSGASPVSFRDPSVLQLLSVDIPCKVERNQPLDGFGLMVTPEKGVQLGMWKEDQFKGYQMEYNSQRIYGIDISRFQHEKGRKRYSIQWKKLRITSLGTLSKKKISGVVDYPVSFCYIKATEGVNIRNRYYAGDYVQAKRNGIKVGNYHFFSTRTPGHKQALWYLKNCRYRKGDLPPVLDVEPSDAQIRAMGGADKMFREVRAWLDAVEARTGARPILYISQRFVNKYLPLAPDLKEGYQVWIARYGEYKPDVHMLFWQLSPDGRVRGIKPEVDINVFNGYEEKYREFVDGL